MTPSTLPPPRSTRSMSSTRSSRRSSIRSTRSMSSRRSSIRSTKWVSPFPAFLASLGSSDFSSVGGQRQEDYNECSVSCFPPPWNRARGRDVGTATTLFLRILGFSVGVVARDASGILMYNFP
ncbi:hypothetical protein M758_9G185700 [Ceratodon purpureus]|nr:hypothetical protein M758_9G185700 [Ceratodon purpureus]